MRSSNGTNGAASNFCHVAFVDGNDGGDGNGGDDSCTNICTAGLCCYDGKECLTRVDCSVYKSCAAVYDSSGGRSLLRGGS